MSPIRTVRTKKLLLASLSLLVLAPACAVLDPLVFPFDVDAGSDAGADAGADGAADALADLAECDGGETVTATCGNCGTAPMTCLHGSWVYGDCQGEGECAWGAEEVCGASLTGVRTCLANCTWGGCWTPSP
jgi:hypothetical protein